MLVVKSVSSRHSNNLLHGYFGEETYSLSTLSLSLSSKELKILTYSILSYKYKRYFLIKVDVVDLRSLLSIINVKLCSKKMTDASFKNIAKLVDGLSANRVTIPEFNKITDLNTQWRKKSYKIK